MSDFPDLFATPEPARAEPRVFSVSEVTRAVRSVIEDSFPEVWVEGEVSNYRQQASGHQYFTLKDATSQLSCVLFARGGMWRKAVPMSDGMMVQAKGRLTVYEARGQYQMTVSLVQAGGAGLLQAKFEALKRKLAAEGLFDEERKRPLPRFPRTLGIITSPTGAALRDMLNILARRAPWLRVIVSPVRVQGDGSAEEMVAALKEMNRESGEALPTVDVIVIGRGGGSVEDLWEFNEEVLARAIAASEIPVISAVGHEIDFTIADFVADLRAPTPSAAAELVAPDTAELLRQLAQTGAQMRRCLLKAVEHAHTRLLSLTRSALFREPVSRLQQASQRLDHAGLALFRESGNRLSILRQQLADLHTRLKHHRPDQLLALRRQELTTLSGRLSERAQRAVQVRRERLRRAGDVLRLLSPEATLERGYSLTTKADGKVVRSTKEVVEGEVLLTRLRDGVVETKVAAVRRGRGGK